MAIAERSAEIGITEALEKLDEVSRVARIEREHGTLSGKNIIPDLTRKAREKRITTIINGKHPDLDSVPNIYRDSVFSGKTLIVDGYGVHVVS
ncbi:MAG: hypothetical protein ABH816_03590 [Candidatus Levyibacteriota bacterium]